MNEVEKGLKSRNERLTAHVNPLTRKKLDKLQFEYRDSTGDRISLGGIIDLLVERNFNQLEQEIKKGSFH